MIRYFPEPYPDELLYSWMARAYVKSGYPAYVYMAEDYYKSRMTTPTTEFLNPMTEEAKEAITKIMPMDDVLKNHTMIPYYIRFASKEERIKAFEAALKTDVETYTIPRFRKQDGYFLKYCPVCVKWDREIYGETYWHREHQIDGIRVCPYHKCYLLQSSVKMSKSTPHLFYAEGYIPEENKVVHNNSWMEIRLARYVIDVFNSYLDMDGDVGFGDYFHFKLSRTQYCTPRGLQIRTGLLIKDFTDYYQEMPYVICADATMRKLLLNFGRNPLYVCMMALFLDIPVEELTYMRLPDIMPTEWFDMEIKRMHDIGLKYPEIARRLNSRYEYVKEIGEGRICKYKSRVYKPIGGKKARDWERFDKDMLPEVKKAVRRVESQKKLIPKNVTVAGIERDIDLVQGTMKKMPRCKKYIENHRLSQPELWAKKVVWAAKQVVKNKDLLNWKHIREYTNMRNPDFQACKPYLDRYADAELADRIKNLL